MKRFILTLSLIIGLISCNNKTAKIECDGEPTISTVTDTDIEMNDAIKTANQKLHQ